MLLEYKFIHRHYIYIYIYIYNNNNKNLANYDFFKPSHKPTAHTFFYPVQSLNTNKVELPAKGQSRKLCIQYNPTWKRPSES